MMDVLAKLKAVLASGRTLKLFQFFEAAW